MYVLHKTCEGKISVIITHFKVINAIYSELYKNSNG